MARLGTPWSFKSYPFAGVPSRAAPRPRGVCRVLAQLGDQGLGHLLADSKLLFVRQVVVVIWDRQECPSTGLGHGSSHRDRQENWSDQSICPS